MNQEAKIPMGRQLVMLACVCAVAATLGCAQDTTDPMTTPLTCQAPYAPFDAANYQEQLLRVGAYDQIATMPEADGFGPADFTMIASLYEETASLREKVTSRTDDHAGATVVEVGTELDAAIMGAIAAGSAGEDVVVQGMIVDKTLQRFFYLSVHHEMLKSQDPAATAEDVQGGWDEAFGYFGLSNDGQAASGIAATLQERDEEFGLNLTSEVYDGFIEGRCAVAEGDTVAAAEIIDRVDLAMLRGFAASVIHEMDEIGEDPLVKGWEARLYWDIVADHVRRTDPAAYDAVTAEFEGGVETADPAVVRDSVNRAFGLGL